MRISYQKKHDAILKAIEQYFGSKATVVGQGAGLHVVVQLHDVPTSETEIIRLAAQNGVNLFPFSATCVSGTPATTHLLLGFGGMSTAEIRQGIEIVSRIFA
jgi:GntR family transcriptional regulator/MocR family aminotransferase